MKVTVQTQKLSILYQSSKNSLLLEFQEMFWMHIVSEHLKFVARCPQQDCLKDQGQKEFRLPIGGVASQHLPSSSRTFSEMPINLWRALTAGPSPRSQARLIFYSKCVFLFLLFQIFDFSFTEEEMKDIEALNKNIRYVELLMWVLGDHELVPAQWCWVVKSQPTGS